MNTFSFFKKSSCKKAQTHFKDNKKKYNEVEKLSENLFNGILKYPINFKIYDLSKRKF